MTLDTLKSREPRTWMRVFLVTGAAALVLFALIMMLRPSSSIWDSYLNAVIFWLQIPLGSMGFLMLHNLVGGNWGRLIRPVLLASLRLLWFMPLLFLPVFFGLDEVFPWAVEGVTAKDPLVAHKSAYLNVPFFIIRALIYFGIWAGLAFFLRREPEELEPDRELRYLSAWGLVAYILTMSFASFDWMMSREPHWYSTVYGLIVVVGQGLGAMAFAIIVTAWRYQEAIRERVREFHDLGNLLLAFMLTWAYLSFMQFLIIWMGNLPEEVIWYAKRFEHGWQSLPLFLVAFSLVFPFFVLLSRRSKRSFRVLGALATALFFCRLVELFWLVAPSGRDHGFELRLADVLAWVAVGGLSAYVLLRNDPSLIQYANEEGKT